MAAYDNLRAVIAANVYQNNNNEVTADMVKTAMNEMVNSLGAEFQFGGVAVPTGPGPGTPDYKVAYLASTPGIYSNFGGITLADGEVAILKWDGSWSKEVMGIASASAIAALNAAIQAVDSTAISRDAALGGRIDAQNAGIAQFEEAVQDQVDNYPMVTIEGNVTNAPDGEDLTTEDDKLKFANRSALFGKGYVILRRGKTFAEQVTLQNTIYEIRYNFDLGGADVTIPDGCVLKFVGGRISSGSLTIKRDTQIVSPPCKIFDGVTLVPDAPKSNLIKYSIESLNLAWFGGVGDASTDNSAALQLAVDCAASLGCHVLVPRGRYNISRTIELYNGSSIIGDQGAIQNTSNQNSVLLAYNGETGSPCLHCVDAEFIVIRNIGITNATTFICDGLAFDGSLVKSEIVNCLFYGCRYGIYGNMTAGFSFNKLESLQITDCHKGIFIESSNIVSQYVTFNELNRVTITRCRYAAIDMTARIINTLHFVECNIVNVGYGAAYDASDAAKDHTAIILNQSKQGSVLFTNSYFENIYYSPDGSIVLGYDYTKDAVISISGTALTFDGCRFANTMQVVKSNGGDKILFLNCLDNGYLVPAPYYTALVALLGVSSILIRGFQFATKAKDIIYGPFTSANYMSSVSISGLFWSGGVKEDSCDYSHNNAALFYIGSAVGSGLVSKYPVSPTTLPETYIRNVQRLVLKYVEDVETDVSTILRNEKLGELEIVGADHTHMIAATAASYTCVYDARGFACVRAMGLKWAGMAAKPYFLRTDAAFVTKFIINNLVVTELSETGRLVVLQAQDNVQQLEISNVDNQSGKVVNTSNSHHTDVLKLFGNTNVTKFSDIHSGTTANRPTNVFVGHRYFDETLGYPIWWNGATWVDATGNIIQ